MYRALASLAMFLSGCSHDLGAFIQSADDGSVDAGMRWSDADVPDTGVDGGVVDASVVDSPTVDAPDTDAPMTDGGTDARVLVPDGGPPDAGAPDAGPPCLVSSPAIEHLSVAGRYCEDGFGGVYLGQDIGSCESYRSAMYLPATCARWNVSAETPDVTIVIEPLSMLPPACGSPSCGSGYCGFGRRAWVFDDAAFRETISFPSSGRTTFVVRNVVRSVIVCHTGENQWQDQIHVVSVSCR